MLLYTLLCLMRRASLVDGQAGRLEGENLCNAGQIRTVGNGMKQGRGRSEEVRIDGEDGSRRLNQRPPVGARPTALLAPTSPSSKAHPSLPPEPGIMLSTL